MNIYIASLIHDDEEIEKHIIQENMWTNVAHFLVQAGILDKDFNISAKTQNRGIDTVIIYKVKDNNIIINEQCGVEIAHKIEVFVATTNDYE